MNIDTSWKHTIVKREVDGTHYYFVDGSFYPSVTKILEEAGPVPNALKNWFKTTAPDEINDKSAKSLEFGSKMHDAYARLLQGEELNLDEDYPATREKKHIVSLVEWYREFNPEVIDVELVVASVKKSYAGTLDLVCKIQDKLWIIDFKTSAGIYDSYFWQVEAYRNAYHEMTGVFPDFCGIVRTGTLHKSHFEFKQSTKNIEGFMRIYDTYLDMNGGKIPQPQDVDVYPSKISLKG